jgi:ribonucleoside-diphosphate reductase alpha chain
MSVAIPSQTMAFFTNDELRARIFYEKYALRDKDGKVAEATPFEMWQRVAREIASVEPNEKTRKQWEQRFNWLLEDFRFVPGGRIMFGAGQPRRATLLNCYVLAVRQDSLESIFEWCKEAARTYSLGGGCGTDISILRPRGAPVNNSALHSTGAVSFMDLMSMTTGTIGQNGRRGALMITMRIDHPDVLDFITVKNDTKRTKVRFANISLRVTDEFMRAVREGGEYTVWYDNPVVGRLEKRLPAREVWNTLIQNAHASAEPGVIFWDSIKRYSTSEYNGMEVISTNPCSEIPLEDGGACCLGSINLARFVQDPFGTEARVDWEGLEKATRYAVRFLDDVLSYNDPRHPLPIQREASRRSRRIGVGFTGLGDMLCLLGLKYDTEEAIGEVDRMFERIKNIAYDTSADLAVEKGTFPAYDPDHHMKSPFIRGLSPKIQEKIRNQGLRNVAILTVPPVGSGAALAGVTSGIEPIFARSYTRRSESLSQEFYKVYHPLIQTYMDRYGIQEESRLPEFFVTSHEIQPEFRVKMQAAIQKHIDHSISSTVNLPEDSTVEDVSRIYFLAWEMGCKGITVYREGSREGVLITEAISTAEPAAGRKEAVSATAEPGVARVKPRPYKRAGTTLSKDTPLGTVHITMNDDEEGPAEVFVTIGRAGSDITAMAEGYGRMISLYLRTPSAIPLRERVQEMVCQLRGIGGARSVGFGEARITSLADALARAMEEHWLLSEPLNGNGQDAMMESRPLVAVAAKKTSGNLCKCGMPLVHENGCQKCYNCGHSEC